MVQAILRIAAGNLRPFVIALLPPVVVVVSAAILLALLGIFVAWLTVVGVLVAAIVIADLIRLTMRRLALAPAGTFERPAVGVPGR